jgi:oligosaccharide repeat unit polymerase
MRFQANYLDPVFFAAWSCVALIAIWQYHVGLRDSTAALVAGAVLLVSLAFSRFILKLPFNTAPMLYLALLGLFHLGLVVPWALGVYDIGRTPWFVPYGIARGLSLLTYAIIAYQVGLLLAVRFMGGEAPLLNRRDLSIKDSSVFVAGSILFISGAAMFVIGVTQLPSNGYDRLIYSQTFRLRAESDPRFFGAGMLISFIGLCIVAAGASRRQMRIVFWYTGILFTVLFFLGFRGPAITAALLVYAVAFKKGLRLPRWLPVVAVAALLVAVPLMSIIREEPMNERSLSSSLGKINILDGPAEVGESIRPLVETADLIGPGNYRYGKTYLLAIKGILPNLAFRWQAPSTESIDDLSPNHWITAMVDPWARKNYQGIGFSGVAEPYMNFGIAGVVIYFILLAFLLVRLELVSIQSSYALACWALVVGPLLLASTRNDYTNVLRPVVWGLIFLGAIRVLAHVYRALGRVGEQNKVSFNNAHHLTGPDA